MNIIILTLSAIVGISDTFCQHNRVIYTIFGINRHMLENMVENLFLVMIMSDNISIELWIGNKIYHFKCAIRNVNHLKRNEPVSSTDIASLQYLQYRCPFESVESMVVLHLFSLFLCEVLQLNYGIPSLDVHLKPNQHDTRTNLNEILIRISRQT